MVSLLKFFTFASFLFLTACPLFDNQESERSKFLQETLNSYTLNKKEVLTSLDFFTESPHPLHSPRQKEVRDYIVSKLRDLKLNPIVQTFKVQTPNPNITNMLSASTVEKEGFNIHVRLNLVDKADCVIGLASHYDTKEMEGFSYVGANDGGSSTVLLLDLARYFLEKKKSLNLQCDVEMIWFDGEESILPGWNDGLHSHPAHIVDHTYGSRYFVDQLKPCECNSKHLCESGTYFVSLILLDMLGYKDLKLTLDSESHPVLRDVLLAGASFIGRKNLIDSRLLPIADDHISFKEKGIPVLDIIDFNHLHLWHTPLDLLETVSLDSLEVSGKLTLYVVLSLAHKPTLLDIELCK